MFTTSFPNKLSFYTSDFGSSYTNKTVNILPSNIINGYVFSTAFEVSFHIVQTRMLRFNFSVNISYVNSNNSAIYTYSSSFKHFFNVPHNTTYTYKYNELTKSESYNSWTFNTNSISTLLSYPSPNLGSFSFSVEYMYPSDAPTIPGAITGIAEIDNIYVIARIYYFKENTFDKNTEGNNYLRETENFSAFAGTNSWY